MPAMCDHAADGSEKGDTTIDDGIAGKWPITAACEFAARGAAEGSKHAAMMVHFPSRDCFYYYL
ncbi:unnamed protein product [Trichogramma brassicae]|uniref:Uncharacterized protein n=1 Tax=Trichogramma brassicae TaxID=86971 RepID=A0A6H5I4W0_9HYME|nr:unnamed protein product [Trichogramma brassicae]